ncbi:hypothetical protein PS847_02744 [Pseudomonas fluorescens]|jgi:hypothetical protein|uniref:Uncharacterized protein n=1 Tax=Pseudomonas fluorescens TaxID=294 RepID=A0A5E7KD79_PSEFL|nr:hypothetical protein PS847_02744 [Pseudomonas fluorescens]
MVGACYRNEFDAGAAIALYAVTADAKSEDLLANGCDSLASARTITNDFANLNPHHSAEPCWESRN